MKYNCWTCAENVVRDSEGNPCAPWCLPYQLDVAFSMNGVVEWGVAVGLDDMNMPSMDADDCPCWNNGRRSLLTCSNEDCRRSAEYEKMFPRGCETCYHLGEIRFGLNFLRR